MIVFDQFDQRISSVSCKQTAPVQPQATGRPPVLWKQPSQQLSLIQTGIILHPPSSDEILPGCANFVTSFFYHKEHPVSAGELGQMTHYPRPRQTSLGRLNIAILLIACATRSIQPLFRNPPPKVTSISGRQIPQRHIISRVSRSCVNPC